MTSKNYFIVLLTLFVQFTFSQTTVEWDLATEPGGITQEGFASIIQKARNHFSRNRNDTIIIKIKAGEHFIEKTTTNIYGVDMSKRMFSGPNGRLIFQGEGMDKTTLVFEDGLTMFMARGLERAEFNDMHLTRKGYSYTYGIFVSAKRGEITLDMLPEPDFPSPKKMMLATFNAKTSGRYLFKYPHDPIFEEQRQQWGIPGDSTKLPKLALDSNNNEIPNRWIIPIKRSGTDLSKAPFNLSVGDTILVKCKYDGNSFFIVGGKDIVFKNIKWTHTTRSIMRETSNLKFIGCRIEKGAPINGVEPFYASSSGGIQINQPGLSIVSGVEIEDFYSNGTSDDPIALYNVDGTKLKNIELIGTAPMRVDTGATNTCIQNLTMREGMSISFFSEMADGTVTRLNYTAITPELFDEVNGLEPNKLIDGCDTDLLNMPRADVEESSFLYSMKNNQITIVSEEDPIQEVTIYSMEGSELIRETNLNATNVSINSDRLENGIYVLKVKTSVNYVSKKIYIER